MAVTAEQLRTLQHSPGLMAAAADDLATATALRADWPAGLVAAATEQAALRARAREVFPDIDPHRLLVTREGLEQASAPAVAAHRARRYADLAGTVLDLCCGLGAELAALAAVRPGRVTVGVDRDEAHAVCARTNTSMPVVVADVRDLRLDRTPVEAVVVDPARRRDGRRGGSEPPLSWCTALPVARVGVKAAPGLDLDRVPAGWEVEFVAVDRALKEAAMWSPAWASAHRRATVLPSGDSLVADPAAPAPGISAPLAYLLDPNPAVTRAGAVADLAAAVGGQQIDTRIAFLTADAPMVTPFGRLLAVEASLPFGVKPLTAELRRLDIGSVDIRRRGLAGDVEELRRRLRPTGTRRATVVLTRHRDRPWALVATDVAGEAGRLPTMGGAR